MESARGPRADCKSARIPGPDGNISAPPLGKDECLPGSRGDGGKGPRVDKAYVEDSVFSLTRGKGPEVVSVCLHCPNARIPVESAKGSRFLLVDDKELSTGKVPSAAVEKSLHF